MVHGQKNTQKEVSIPLDP